MEKMFELIRASLWNTEIPEAVDREVYDEMQKHKISLLPACILSRLAMPDDLRQEWKRQIIKSMLYLEEYKAAQENIPISVPYLILKGTTAAKYYPYPEYRAMGDIDIITDRKDFDRAYHDMLDNGYFEIKKLNREIALAKNGVVVELHQYFASLNDVSATQFMDDTILSNINPSHTLPDPVNGLVLLEHISQHLEFGLGLRQIIDWMMFADKYLSDENWDEFRSDAQKIGLEQLAITTTRMCEIFLGLPKKPWTAEADDALCRQFMEYILSCGDFGNKKTTDSDISEIVFSHARTPKAAFRLLQKQGLRNWKAAQKYKALRCFAWAYQIFRYATRGLSRKHATAKLKAEYAAALKRNRMFDVLGVKTTAKGVVVYKDGKYKKE